MPNDVHELQHRLEQNRALVRNTGRSTLSRDHHESEVRTETRPCRACGNDVEASVLYVDGRRTPSPPITCDACLEAEEADLARAGLVLVDAKPVDIRDRLRAIGVNTRKHGDATLADFDSDGIPWEAAKELATTTVGAGRHDRVRGLYLVGDVGVGKSHLAVAIMRRVLQEGDGVTVVYDSADRLITKVQDSYGHGTTDQLIEHRAAADLYVLDDLGREKPTADALRVLVTILDEREGAPTVITSNYKPIQLGMRHGNEVEWGRVQSRLGDEVYRYVLVEGRDRRFREGA